MGTLLLVFGIAIDRIRVVRARFPLGDRYRIPLAQPAPQIDLAASWTAERPAMWTLIIKTGIANRTLLYCHDQNRITVKSKS
jgi:hypothetical protein